MCKAFSGIILENGEVVWKFAVDSHETLIRAYNEKAQVKLIDNGNPRTWARFEVTPNNGDYINPNKWTFRLDERTPPAWWSKVHEGEAWSAHKAWLKKLRKILPSGQKIIHPFCDVKAHTVTAKDKVLLKAWASVRDSVGASVWASVGASVWASVRDSVWASVRDSVQDSVWDSVWDSVRVYVGSLFTLPRESWLYASNIKSKAYPFQPCVDLWKRGLIPSFDGKTWRLHQGPQAKVVYEWTPEEK